MPNTEETFTMDLEQNKAGLATGNSSAEFKGDIAHPGEGSFEAPATELQQSSTCGNSIHFPDGGSEAWLQAVGGFFLMFNTWGLINTYGVFQAYYTTMNPPVATPSLISWIGSVQSFLLLIVSAACGRLFDIGYGRTMTYIGATMLVLGLFMASLSGNSDGRPIYWQLLLSQGICCGLGMGFMMVPSVGIVSTYFNKKRSFALGVVASGSSFGGMTYPIMIRQLLKKFGFNWSIRILAFAVLGTLGISCLLLKQREDIVAIRKKEMKLVKERKAAGIKEGPGTFRNMFKDWAFISFVIGMFWTSLGLYSPFFYIEAFTLKDNIDLKGLDPFYLISIMNASGAVGRLLPGFLADKTGPLNMQTFSTLCVGIAALSWISVTGLKSLLVFAVFYGFFSGNSISLPPASVARLTSDISVLGTRMGFMFSCAGLGVLAGPPISGAIQEGVGGNRGRDMVKIFTGVVLIAGATGMWGARVLNVGWKILKKS